MPLYEFRCQDCGGVTQVLTRSVSQQASPVCRSCTGTRLTRMVSPFAHHRSVQTAGEGSGSPEAPGPDYYKDPRNIGRKLEQDFQRMGMEVPREIQDRVESARGGELPKELDL